MRRLLGVSTLLTGPARGNQVDLAIDFSFAHRPRWVGASYVSFSDSMLVALEASPISLIVLSSSSTVKGLSVVCHEKPWVLVKEVPGAP